MVEPNQRVIGSLKGYISSAVIRHEVPPMIQEIGEIQTTLGKRLPYQYRHSRLRPEGGKEDDWPYMTHEPEFQPNHIPNGPIICVGFEFRKFRGVTMVGDEGGWQVVGRRRIDNITSLFIESIQMSRVKGALKDYTHRINSDEKS
jgi:hypothetical protein